MVFGISRKFKFMKRLEKHERALFFKKSTTRTTGYPILNNLKTAGAAKLRLTFHVNKDITPFAWRNVVNFLKKFLNSNNKIAL